MKHPGKHNGMPRHLQLPPPTPPPFSLGERVRLLGGPSPAGYTDFAVLGVVAGNGMVVVLIAEWDLMLAPVWAYPATGLQKPGGATMWLGEYPSKITVVPG